MFNATVAAHINWAATAVIIDSIVTCFVGWKLNKTARRETMKAAETVKPALNEALGQAVVTLLPIITETIKQHLDAKERGDNADVRTLYPSGDRSTLSG